MNHPKPEEWVPYLYGEAKHDSRRELQAHLESCPECREQVQSWKRSLGRLEAWKLPRMGAPLELFAPALKWAAAAALVLCTGFALGHLSAARPDLHELRAALEPQIRQQLRQETAQLVREEVDKAAAATLIAAGQQTEKFLTAYATASESTRAEEINRLYVALKKEVDTVAVNTDAGFRQAEQQLVRLAIYTPPTGSSPSEK